MDGNYEPKRPEEFVCNQSIALIVSKTGEMEVFGEDEKLLGKKRRLFGEGGRL